MKPIKNRVFCTNAARPKMLFKTQSKADNFIRYNAAEIEAASGVAPRRSYWCPACGGWHVTHRHAGGLYGNLDVQDAQAADLTHRLAVLKQDFNRTDFGLWQGRIDDIRRMLPRFENKRRHGHLAAAAHKIISQYEGEIEIGRRGAEKQAARNTAGALVRCKVLMESIRTGIRRLDLDACTAAAGELRSLLDSLPAGMLGDAKRSRYLHTAACFLQDGLREQVGDAMRTLRSLRGGRALMDGDMLRQEAARLEDVSSRLADIIPTDIHTRLFAGHKYLFRGRTGVFS